MRPGTRLASAANTSIAAAPPVSSSNASKAISFQNEMHQVFVDKGKDKDWKLFVNAIEKGAIPEMKKILLGLQNAEHARLLAKTFLQLKSWGFTGQQVRTVFQQLAKLSDADVAKTLGVLGKPTGALGKLMSTTGDIATRMGLLVTIVECVIHGKKGNYAAIFGEIYKFVLGKYFPWAAFIDTLQTFIELLLPNSWKGSVIFKVLKVANPIGLGAVAVESIAASATAAYNVIINKGDLGAAIPRLDKLVKRIKKSPASGLATLGENAGDAAYELSKMSASEWGYVFHLNWRRFKSLFSN